MTPTTHKQFWTRLIQSMQAIALIIGTTSCAISSSETWHCYDTKGNPAEGVLIVCHYGLSNYDKTGVNCRFSDAKGKIVLDLDADTPLGLERGYSCIYSSKLRSGCADQGTRWHEGETIPKDAVYFDEWNNKIYMKSGIDNPVIWHNALNALIHAYEDSRRAVNGGRNLNAQISQIVLMERALFIKKYGENEVPIGYLKTDGLVYFPTLQKNYKSGLKFKDITLPIQKPL